MCTDYTMQCCEILGHHEKQVMSNARSWRVITRALLFLLLWAAITAGVSFSANAQCASNVEPTLGTDSQQPVPPSGVVSAIRYVGVFIITTVFKDINGIMATITSTFYTAVVTNPNYINAVNSLILLYITVYGIMIMFNMASHRTGEVMMRLFKIGLVWAVMTGGWTFFSNWFGAPLIGSLNGIINSFAQTGVGGNANGVNLFTGQVLDPTAMNAIAPPMTLIFSFRYIAMILALLTTGWFGWIFAAMLIWAMIEFVFMIVGAIVTYVKAIIGLTFLFALAPIFFAFILFQQSRQVFLGWLNHVLAFFPSADITFRIPWFLFGCAF